MKKILNEDIKKIKTLIRKINEQHFSDEKNVSFTDKMSKLGGQDRGQEQENINEFLFNLSDFKDFIDSILSDNPDNTDFKKISEGIDNLTQDIRYTFGIGSL